MGSLQAHEMAELTDLDTALTWHLRANHYPPIGYEMVPVCREAIEAVNDYDFEREIDLPLGVLWRGLTTAPASAIVEGHRLYAWIQIDEED